MNTTEKILLALLVVASGLMSWGAFMIFAPAGFILGGVLLAIVGTLFFFDDGGTR